MASNKSTTITASVIVEFGSSDSKSAILEVDDREDGYNGGTTSFPKGTQSVGFLLFMPLGYVIIDIVSSVGDMSYTADTYKDISDIVTFANEEQQTLQYPHWLEPVDITPLGSNHSGVSYNLQSETISLSKRPTDTDGTPVPRYRAAACRVEYASPCCQLVLNNIPANAETAVVIVVIAPE